MRRFIAGMGTMVLLAVLLASSVYGQSEPTKKSRLFVGNTRSNSVSVIDSSTGQVIAEIRVGIMPCRVSISPDGMKVYVSNNFSNTISVIDTVNLINTATIPVGEKPQESAFTPD